MPGLPGKLSEDPAPHTHAVIVWAALRGFRFPWWLLHLNKAVSEKLLRDRGHGRQGGWSATSGRTHVA